MDPLLKLVYSNPNAPDPQVFLWYNDSDFYPSLDDWKKRFQCILKLKPDHFLDYTFKMFTNLSIQTAERSLLLASFIVELEQEQQDNILKAYKTFQLEDVNVKKFQRAKELLLNPLKVDISEKDINVISRYLGSYKKFLERHYPTDEYRILTRLFKNASSEFTSLSTADLKNINIINEDLTWDAAKAILLRWTKFVQLQGFLPFLSNDDLLKEKDLFNDVKGNNKLLEVLKAENRSLFEEVSGHGLNKFEDKIEQRRVLGQTEFTNEQTVEYTEFAKTIYQWIQQHVDVDVTDQLPLFETPLPYQKLTKKDIPQFKQFSGAMKWVLNLHEDDYNKNKKHIWSAFPTPATDQLKTWILHMDNNKWIDFIQSPMYPKIIDYIWNVGGKAQKQYAVGLLSNKLQIPWDDTTEWFEKSCALSIVIEQIHKGEKPMSSAKITDIANFVKVHTELIGPVETSGVPWQLLHMIKTKIDIKELDISEFVEHLNVQA